MRRTVSTRHRNPEAPVCSTNPSEPWRTKAVKRKRQDCRAPSNTMRINEDLLSPSATPSGATTPDKSYDEQQDNRTNRRVDDGADDAYPEMDAQPC
jgi:hypothetical protein